MKNTEKPMRKYEACHHLHAIILRYQTHIGDYEDRLSKETKKGVTTMDPTQTPNGLHGFYQTEIDRLRLEITALKMAGEALTK